nr:DNA mismatch repair endonuclease MutL [Salinarchaeum sp. Harcht-Bsk1]
MRPLDDDTIAKIAAGEVVERPASVAKELVENALDAGATRIEIAVEEGGLDLVEVRDDGVGMTEADCRAAVREHTTSKLSDAGELHAVETLGFRGEALHTIGAVADLEITAKSNPDRREADAATESDSGTRLVYRGGDVETVEHAAHPGGTTVAVTDLFHNTPARRKYLSEPATEFRHVSRVVGRYALANPDVAISFSHDGREVFATTGDGDRVAAIMAVYGREVAESMIEVDADPDTDAVDRIVGHVSDPETTRASREYLATYVNDRAVASDTVRGAIVEAYSGQLSAERYPFAVLFVEVPPERVDVNVHPRKQAVRFDDAGAVEDAVIDAVRDALLEDGIIRASAPRGVSKPAEARVDPGDGDQSDAADSDAADPDPAESDATDSDADDSAAAAAGSAPPSTGSTDAPTTPSAEEGSTTAEGAESDGSRSAPRSTGATDPERSDAADRTHAADRTDAVDRSDTAESSDPASGSGSGSAPLGDPSHSATPEAGDWTARLGSPIDSSVTATDQQTLDGESVSASSTEFDSLPPLRVLGQHAETYVVAAAPDGLVLIDQHAADERIHYERLRDAVDSGTAQALATPVELSLTPTEAETYDTYAPALKRLGFHADREDRTLTVRSVPTVLGETLDPDAIRDVFGALLSGGDGEGTVEAMADELLGDLACAPAVKGNTSLTEGSVTALLEALDACENPYACPHGRPTLIRIDGDELAERFERDYPGHGTRRD